MTCEEFSAVVLKIAAEHQGDLTKISHEERISLVGHINQCPTCLADARARAAHLLVTNPARYAQVTESNIQLAREDAKKIQESN